MSCKSDGEGEDHSGNSTAAEVTVTIPLRVNTPRSITPKTLFTNLDEAHHAITSRVAPRSVASSTADKGSAPSSRAPSSLDVCGPTDSAGSIASGEARPTNSAEVKQSGFRQCPKPSMSTVIAGAVLGKTPTTASPAVSSLALSSHGANPISGGPNSRVSKNSTRLGNSETDGEPEDDMYDDCYPPSLVAESPSSLDSRQPWGSLNNQSYHSTKYSRRLDSHYSYTRRASNHGTSAMNKAQINHLAHGPPAKLFPDPPHLRGGTSHPDETSGNRPFNFSRPVQSICSVTSPQDLTAASDNPSQVGEPGHSATARASGVCTKPDKSAANNVSSDVDVSLQSQPEGDNTDHVCPSSRLSLNMSTAGISTDSDDDPFPYDRGSMTVFLQPSRERQVSAALRRVSDGSFASVGGPSHHSSPQTPATPPRARSNNPFHNRFQDYKASTVEYDWDEEDDAHGLKISVVRSPSVAPKSPTKPVIGLSDFVREENQRHRKEIRTLMSDGGDWETVADSVGQFDSNRAVASSAGLISSHPVRTTGSSIADYSDTSSFHVPQFDEFSSREHILPVSNASPSARYPRTLRGTDRPVFPPKARLHRVNGYLQSAQRKFTDTSTGSSGNSARSALVAKLSASIRIRHARRRAQQQDQFAHESWHRSRFESLDSLPSTYSEQAEETNGQRVCHARENGEVTSRSENRDAAGVRECDNEQGRQSPILKEPSPAHLRGSNPIEPRNVESPTLFSFPLISLQEAARRVAARVDTEDDCTVTSGGRTRNNSSIVSSKATQRTTPPSPHILKLHPTRPRRPTSASILGIRMSHQGQPEYGQGHMIGRGRGMSDATSFRSRVPLAPRGSAMSRSFKSPLNPGSPWSSHPVSGVPSVFGSPPCLVGRDKRGGARATHHDFQQITTVEAGTPAGTAGEEACLSWEARGRRKAYYYAMCVLCLLPFFAPLAYRGTFDAGLAWYTQGEVGSLTRRQRRRVGAVGTVCSCIWLLVLAVFITVVVYNKRLPEAHH